MLVLGWVMGVGTLWVVSAWVIAVVLGGVILRSGTVRAERSASLRPGAVLPDVSSSLPVGVPRSRSATVDLVPRPRAALPRRGPRAGCVRAGRPAGRD